MLIFMICLCLYLCSVSTFYVHARQGIGLYLDLCWFIIGLYFYLCLFIIFILFEGLMVKNMCFLLRCYKLNIMVKSMCFFLRCYELDIIKLEYVYFCKI